MIAERVLHVPQTTPTLGAADGLEGGAGGGEPEPYVSPETTKRVCAWLASLRDGGDEAPGALSGLRDKVVGHGALRRHLVLRGQLVETLLPYLDAHRVSPASVCRDAIAIVGSVAHGGPDEAARLVDADVPRRLLDAIVHAQGRSDSLAVDAARALRTLYRHGGTPRDLPFSDEFSGAVHALLKDGAGREYALVLLANCCDGRGKQDALVSSGAVDAALGVLDEAGASRGALEAALDLLAAVTRENADACGRIVSCGAAESLLRHVASGCATTQILCAAVLANAVRAQALHGRAADVSACVLPVLSCLLEARTARGVRVRAAQVLALLASDCVPVQRAASASSVPSLLVAMLREGELSSQTHEPMGAHGCASSLENQREPIGSLGGASSPPSVGCAPSQRDAQDEAALLALAALASFEDECRAAVVSAGALPAVLRLLDARAASVRAAACQATRALSRSVRTLRTALVDAGVVSPLLRLLGDDAGGPAVQSAAAAALCNVVLDFSPMKEAVLRGGGVSRLAAIVAAAPGNADDLRFNALWALKNLLYQADGAVKAAVIDALGPETLLALASDAEPLPVQEQAMNLLRNLVCERDVGAVLARLGVARVVALVEERMHSASPDVAVHACYVVANACSAPDAAPRAAVASRPRILSRVSAMLAPEQPPALHLAALWCVINLTWRDDPGAAGRVDALCAAGVADRLRALASSCPSTEIRDRLATAMANFGLASPALSSRPV